MLNVPLFASISQYKEISDTHLRILKIELRKLCEGASINHVDGWGEGVSKMFTLLHNSHLVLVSTKEGGGVKYTQKFVHIVYG